jgi:5-methyltetrahydrofolate--homocysteine methyltransferase
MYIEQRKKGGAVEVKEKSWRDLEVIKCLEHALGNGISQYADKDVEEARQKCDAPLDVIEGPLMDGMKTVGDLLGSGRICLYPR